MYICICNAIRDTELRDAARKCAGDVDCVYACLGVQPQCGQCLDEATAILIEERQVAMVQDAMVQDMVRA